MGLRSRFQHTLAAPVSLAGIGIHTGVQVEMTFCPAPVDTGIIFKRVDLPGQPEVPASVECVVDTHRSTTIAIGDVAVHTVEHVLAAVHAYQLDNLIIEISNCEPPIGNGSSDLFVEMIEKGGIVSQEAEIPIINLEFPIFWSEGGTQIVAIPSDEYRISYTLNYPDSKVLGAQFFSLVITPEHFRDELSPCRTFAKYEEIDLLKKQGLIKGGSLDNAVVIQNDAVVNEGGLFFPNEMARHKILDLIGDLSLAGFPFCAHVIAIKSGHTANVAFAKKLFATRHQEVHSHG